MPLISPRTATSAARRLGCGFWGDGAVRADLEEVAMSGARECWVNIYAGGETGQPWTDRKDAEWVIRRGGLLITHRWHICLKPKGAPRRYLGSWEKMQWDDFAKGVGPRPVCKGDVA